jgi:membrane protease subunit (stomatin/prohibitin family)
MAVIDLVKWNTIPGVYVWKFPSDELSTWTQLIVSESQEAILLKGGQMVRVFGAGNYTLDTSNIPALSELFKIAFGGKSPFKAEVWFVNKTVILDVKWGIFDSIQLMDPKYHVMLPIRGFGQFGVQIKDSAKFLIKIVGTLSQFDGNALTSYFKGIVITKVKETIARKLVKDSISILEINAHLSDISNVIQAGIEADLAEFGLKVLHFKVMSISAPEDDASVKQLKAALGKKAEMNIVGFNYQQERSFDTLESAASNPGSPGSGLMGAGIGLGMGLGLGGAMGNATKDMTHQLQLGSIITCPKCAAQIPALSKFCSSCGYVVPQAPQTQSAEQILICDKCGKKSPKGSKFCSSCGNVFNLCGKCGMDNPEDSSHCCSCGTEMSIKCASCGKTAPAGTRFCPDCGKEMTKVCSKCGKLTPLSVKFCAQCGTKLK